jgi:hypothetical protein
LYHQALTIIDIILHIYYYIFNFCEDSTSGDARHSQTTEGNEVTTSTNTAGLSGALYNRHIGGEFGNIVEAYLDETFRNSNRETFYARTLKEEGHEAAEAELIEWAMVMHDHRVADALEPIVNGIAHVLDTTHHAVNGERFVKTDNSLFPFPYRSSRETYGIVLYNLEVPGCGCTQPKGFDKFSKWGELGITSFVVIIDPLRPEENSVVLMLPIRGTRENGEKRNGFVAVVMRRNGEIRSVLKEVQLYSNAAEHLAFGGNQAFGVMEASGGSPCNHVGFPGAQEYITSNLSELAEYLEDVAEQLSDQHEH